MSRRREKFDHLVTIIESRLKAQGSQVTWLDQSLDPNDITEPRVIDITIRRNERLTLVGIRDDRLLDPSGWIADLARQRRNLKADGAIAVAAFRINAALQNEADQQGVMLRPLTRLSDYEIDSWGCESKIALVSVVFQKLHLQAVIHESEVEQVSAQPVLGCDQQGKDPVTILVRFLCDSFRNKLRRQWSRWRVDLNQHGITMDGVPVRALNVIFEARLETERYERVGSIRIPKGKHDLEGELEIYDLSDVKQLPNRLLEEIRPVFEEPASVKPSVKLIGAGESGRSDFDIITLDVIALPQAIIARQKALHDPQQANAVLPVRI